MILRGDKEYFRRTGNTNRSRESAQFRPGNQGRRDFRASTETLRSKHPPNSIVLPAWQVKECARDSIAKKIPGATVLLLAAATILNTRPHKRFRLNRGTGLPGRFTGTGAPSSADNLGKFLPGKPAECLLV
ncbi:MAG: hypothetical protein CMJ81_10835 [Planctomycetaceae bacterium]|nr:hypothetical protein [Planctomycetaceae bacterium]